VENSFEYTTVKIREKRVWLQPQQTVGVCVNTRLRQMETLKDKKKIETCCVQLHAQQAVRLI
jgi:hypothetical protein